MRVLSYSSPATEDFRGGEEGERKKREGDDGGRRRAYYFAIFSGARHQPRSKVNRPRPFQTAACLTVASYCDLEILVGDYSNAQVTETILSAPWLL